VYKRLPDVGAAEPAAPMLTLTIDGQSHAARDGDTVAATLLAAGMSACRTTPVSGSARGPFCMMGVCFDCLVVIDGRPNQQSCMIVAREGMRIERQHGARAVAAGDTPGPGP
jgi:predicted molibdopterin-dependent oxidoreductase YjgC